MTKTKKILLSDAMITGHRHSSTVIEGFNEVDNGSVYMTTIIYGDEGIEEDFFMTQDGKKIGQWQQFDNDYLTADRFYSFDGSEAGFEITYQYRPTTPGMERVKSFTALSGTKRVVLDENGIPVFDMSETQHAFSYADTRMPVNEMQEQTPAEIFQAALTVVKECKAWQLKKEKQDMLCNVKSAGEEEAKKLEILFRQIDNVRKEYSEQRAACEWNLQGEEAYIDKRFASYDKFIAKKSKDGCVLT